MKRSLTDLPDNFYNNKKVFVRVDFNVPLINGKISEDYRIRKAIPTIKYLSERNAKVILASHLGRPKGKINPSLSLKPVAKLLSDILEVPKIKFVDECIGTKVEKEVSRLKKGEIILLENIRFYPEEEEGEKAFSSRLSSLGDIYVNDAFGTSHRKHASTYTMALNFKTKLAGLLIEREINMLSKVRDHPSKPFIIVVGGAKIKDKIEALKNLIRKADKVLIGGAVAYTFLSSSGLSVGDSSIENDLLEWARTVSHNSEKILLPEDHIIAPSANEKEKYQLVKGGIPDGFIGFDIGNSTSCKFSDVVLNGKGTIFWNGPLGFFEVNEFSNGTFSVARSIALATYRGATAVIGGGDTIAALRDSGILETEVSHISTGGGASLEYLGGKKLPGIEVLDEKDIRK
jgi:phosphoglycerate kinase